MMSLPKPFTTAAGWKLTLAPAPPAGAAAGGLAGAASGLAQAALSATPLGGLRGDDSVMLTHTQFRADISVSKGLGLDGGRVRMAIDNLPFHMVQAILAAYSKAAKDKTASGAAGALIGSLKLFWRVTLPYAGLADIADMAQQALGLGDGDPDLAAAFAVTGISVDTDKAGYRLLVEGVDKAWHTLNTERAKTVHKITTAKDVASFCADVGVAVGNPKPALVMPTLTASADGHVAMITPAQRPLDRLADLQSTISRQDKTEGLGSYLIENGTILIGDALNLLFHEPPVDLRDGLDVISIQAIKRDVFDTSGAEQAFSLRVRGNAAIRPGRQLVFNYEKPSLLPAGIGLGYADAAIGAARALAGGGATGDPTLLYVRVVRHLLSTSNGFITEVDGIVVDGKPSAPSGSAARREGSTQGSSTAAGAIHASIERNRHRTLDIAEIREFRAVQNGDSPAQTGDAILGLAEGKGQFQRYRTADVARDKPQRAQSVPYLTPFAWGPFGMVLPRYPGTRVAVVRPEGNPDHAIDIGALWWSGRESNSEAGPAKAEMGDYWLILPVDPSPSLSLPDDASPLSTRAAYASNDLIDSAGRRSIELREFTLRVGEWTLRAPGERPSRPDSPGGIRIEGGDGTAFLEIDSEGNITIKSPKSISIEADEEIKLKVPGVTVRVKDGKMDVS